MTHINSISAATKAFNTLRPFVSGAQMSVMADVCRSEEKGFMFDRLRNMVDTINIMPKTYETDGQGDAAIVCLHYFVGGCDWWITEKDVGDGSGDSTQHQAFGRANLGYGGELGYISIAEIIAAGAEIDLFWTPKTLAEIKEKS